MFFKCVALDVFTFSFLEQSTLWIFVGWDNITILVSCACQRCMNLFICDIMAPGVLTYSSYENGKRFWLLSFCNIMG